MKTAVSTANIATSAASTNAVSSTTTPATVAVKSENIITTNATSAAFTAPLNTNTSGINKRPASLDLNKGAQAKKQRTVTPLLLESPDMANMKTNINTPDLEKILLSSQLLQTPQPGTVFPSKVGVGQVTSEQEEFGKGFEEALSILHNSKNSQAATQLISSNNSGTATSTVNANVTTTATTGMSGGSFTFTDMAPDSNFQTTVKVEPQNSTNSPPVSPIDMETQEKIKLERKRQRNRVAASKCRKRKLERISKLEDRVKQLKGENGDLGMVVKNLKDHVAQLKQQVMEHIATGCSITPVVNGQLLRGK